MTDQFLAVCTHNRTRSVMMGALLGDHLARSGVLVDVSTAGLRETGQPPTAETVRLLAARGFDVSDHRSQQLSADLIDASQLILTAERQHVVHIAGRWRAAFVRTFTLPEIVTRGEAVGRKGSSSLDEWLTVLNAGRPTGLDYMSATEVPEIADPTGRSPSIWRASFDEIDGLTRRLAALLA